MTQRHRIVMVKRQTPKKVTLPVTVTVEHFMQNINEQLVQIYRQTYVLNDRINKEQCLKEDVATEEYNQRKEVLKVHLVN